MQCCAGTVSNRTATPTASVLSPLDYGYPMQIFPGATFRFGLCQKVTPSVYLRVDLMSVPSLRKDNASAYAIHVWGQVSFPQSLHDVAKYFMVAEGQQQCFLGTSLLLALPHQECVTRVSLSLRETSCFTVAAPLTLSCWPKQCTALCRCLC